jgi:hypothetical protein
MIDFPLEYLLSKVYLQSVTGLFGATSSLKERFTMNFLYKISEVF